MTILADLHADTAVALAYDAMLREDAAGAEAVLRDAIAACPLDSRLHVMSAVLAAHRGLHNEAMAHLWRGLAADPWCALSRQQLIDSALLSRTDPDHVTKDFSFDSGERQTACDLDGIRADHRARYAFAARWLRNRWPDCHARAGLDAFAGNGYGSRMVADLTGARMVGLDGSADAVRHAERHFACHRVVFGHAIFPFELREGLFDFAISFESIEHVDDPEAFVRQIASATRGPLIVSVPNEHALPYAAYGPRFEHHVRHFTRNELATLMASAGMPRVHAVLGQDVYRTAHGDIVGLLDEQAMMLHPFREDSQFLLMVCERD